ncbi:meiotically up-regulated gene 113-domain-containing protein [Syncephalis plumigaleata]|nr:meiotically up-regulated gene 113-domain-containing protein [Syncephalis plumigaleata]
MTLAQSTLKPTTAKACSNEDIRNNENSLQTSNTAQIAVTATATTTAATSSPFKKFTGRRADRPNCRGICVGTGRPCTRPMPARAPGTERTKEQYYCYQHKSQAQGGHFGLRIQSNGQYVARKVIQTYPSEVEDIHELMDQLENMQLNNNQPATTITRPTQPHDNAIDSLLDSMTQLSVTDTTTTTASSNVPVTMPEPNPFLSSSTSSNNTSHVSPLGFSTIFLKSRLNQMAPVSSTSNPPSIDDNKPLPPLPVTSSPPPPHTLINYSPFTPAHEKQCQGFIRSSGLRCKRTVKNATAINALGVELRYCHQHISQLPKSGDTSSKVTIPATPSSLSVGNVSEWLPSNAPDTVKARLIVEMAKPISKDDKDHKYYSIPIMIYKIGRTGNLARRLTEWSKQCGYRPRIIDCFPNEHTRSTAVQSNASSIALPTTRSITTKSTRKHPKSPFSHRLERLIHLELMEQYKFSGISCQGCQTVHQEWFKQHRQSHHQQVVVVEQHGHLLEKWLFVGQDM